MLKPSSKKCCAPEGVPSTGKFEDDLSRLCKALGHPARVQIIKILAEDGACISGDLAEAIDLAPSTASEHLKILKEVGLVQGTIDGLKRCYCINREALEFVRKLLAQI